MQHNKIYLSLRESRAFDGPVGDPFGGPAFGRREMPIVPVIGAVASGIAGVGMIGTTVAGISGLGTIIGGAMIAGSVLTIAGTISGNEKLSKIGGMLSLAGGLGAGVAGMTGNITNAAGEVMSVGDVFSNGMGKITDAFNGLTGQTGTVTNAGSDLVTGAVTEANAGVTEVGGLENAWGSGEFAGSDVVGDAGGVTGAIGDTSGPMGSGGFLQETSNVATNTTNQTSGSGGILKSLFGGGDSKSTIGGQILSSVGKYLMGNDEIEALERLRRGDIAMASNGPLIVDPNSPNRKEFEAYAKKYGKDIINFGVNPNANPQTMPSATDHPWLNQYRPGGNVQVPNVTAPKVTAPSAPGILNRAK